MQKLIHKPQREEIKPFCLERERDNYGEVVQLRHYLNVNERQFSVAGPYPGPCRVVQVVLSRQGTGTVNSVFSGLWASRTPYVDVNRKGDTHIASTRYVQGVFVPLHNIPVTALGQDMKMNVALNYSPIWLVLVVEKTAGGAEMFYGSVSLTGFHV